METTFLEELGLSKKASLVYLALLEVGSCLASKLADKTKINRSSVYDALKELIEKGFASYVIRENRKYFQATSPEKILELLKEREISLKIKIPELKKLENQEKEDVSVEIYRGKEGMKTLLEDVLKTNKDFLILGWQGKISELLEFYFPNWDKRRIKLKINRKALVNHESKELIKNQRLTEFRILPKGVNFPSSNVIYGDKIMITINGGKNPNLILIKNKELAETYRGYFEQLWKQAKP